MRTWLSIRVELIQGGGRALWPRPGRGVRGRPVAHVPCAGRRDRHRFRALGPRAPESLRARRRDRRLRPHPVGGPARGVRVRRRDPAQPPERRRAVLYTFDMGDDWTHRAPSPSSASTRSKRSASPTPGPCRTGGGARSPTSTAGAAKPTTARPRCRPTRSSPTFHRCAPGGEDRDRARGRCERRRSELGSSARDRPVLQIDGDSYRMRTHRARLATLPAGRNAPDQVGNSHDRTRGILTIVDTAASRATTARGSSPRPTSTPAPTTDRPPAPWRGVEGGRGSRRRRWCLRRSRPRTRCRGLVVRMIEPCS